MPPTDSGRTPSKIRLAWRMLGTSVPAGVPAAGLALPALGAIGASAKATAEDFNDPPDGLRAPRRPRRRRSTTPTAAGSPPSTTTIGPWYPGTGSAAVIHTALVDIEDHRFYQHGPIDGKGVLRAQHQRGRCGVVQGASP